MQIDYMHSFILVVCLLSLSFARVRPENTAVFNAEAEFEVLSIPVSTYKEPESNVNDVRSFSQSIGDSSGDATEITSQTQSMEYNTSSSPNATAISAFYMPSSSTSSSDAIAGMPITSSSDAITSSSDAITGNATYLETTSSFYASSNSLHSIMGPTSTSSLYASSNSLHSIMDTTSTSSLYASSNSLHSIMGTTSTSSYDYATFTSSASYSPSTTTVVWTTSKPAAKFTLSFTMYASVELAPPVIITNITESQPVVLVEPSDTCIMLSNVSMEFNNSNLTDSIPRNCIILSDDARTCIACYVGFVLDSHNNTCVKCPAGKYRNDKNLNNTCLPCEAGKSTQNVSGQSMCANCNHNTSTMGLTGQAVCTPCAENMLTIRRGSASCVCVPGMQVNASTQMCELCPLGTFDDGKNQAELLKCKNCSAGAYSAWRGSSFCSHCISGTFSRQGSSACTDCPVNTYSSANASSGCTQCYANGFMPFLGQTFCFCIKGFILSANSSTLFCRSCTPGSYGHTISTSILDTPESICRACSVGTYAMNAGQSHCTLCSLGKYADSLGSKQCTECPLFEYSTTAAEGADDFLLCTCIKGAEKRNGSCVPCLAGYYQPLDHATVCSACELGKFSTIAGLYATECDLCDIGFYNDELGKTGCKSCGLPEYTTTLTAGAQSYGSCYCAPGFIKNRYTFECIPCSPGFYTTAFNLNVECVACHRGTYSTVQGRSTLCNPCPFNQYNNLTAQTACKECGSHGFSLTLQEGTESYEQCLCIPGFLKGKYMSECVPCSAGFYQSSIHNKTECTACEKGTFSSDVGRILPCHACLMGSYNDNIARTSCSPCLQPGYGQTLSNGSESIMDCICLAGAIRNNVTLNCDPCPAGHYQPFTNASACIQCSPGKYSDQIGRIQPCIKCPIGTYSSAYGSSDCASCGNPPYSKTLFDASVSAHDCICLPGSKHVFNSLDCEPCPMGFYQQQTNSTYCLACERGKYSNAIARSHECELCPFNTYNDDTAQIICKLCQDISHSLTWSMGSMNRYDCICKPGSARDENTLDCHACPAGYYQTLTNASHCVACEPGKYSNLTARGSMCEPCPRNMYNNISAQTICTTCMDTSYAITWHNGSVSIYDCICKPGSARHSETLECYACPVGFYQLSTNATTCIACEPGKYSNVISRGNDCENCPIGTYSSDTAQISCIKCVQESLSTTIKNGSTSQYACLCKPGSMRLTDCVPCAIGFYQPLTNVTYCIACEQGKYSNVISRGNDCENCPIGTYSSDTAQISCIKCVQESLSTTIKNGSTSQYACLCKPGSMRLTDCVPCAAGFYQPLTNVTYCIACSMGTYSDVVARTSNCLECELGKYMDAISSTYCKQCHNASLSYTITKSSKWPVDCICKPGSKRNLDSLACEACPVGLYQMLTNATHCEVCDAGKYSLIEARDSDCDLCPKGTFSSNVSQTHCVQCGNATTFERGSSSANQCVCREGHVYDASLMRCIPCNQGTFQPFENGTLCYLCQGFSYSFQEASRTCNECLAGSASINKSYVGVIAGRTFDASIDCAPCRSGYYQPNNHSTHCIACPVGYVNRKEGSTACEQCSTQTFNPLLGAISCLPCPENSESGSTGSASCTCKPGSYMNTQAHICISCKPGSYQAVLGSSFCTLCSQGTYAPASGQYEFCIPCSVDTYNPSSGMTTCFECPINSNTGGLLGRTSCRCQSGYSFNSSLSRCIECLAGSYSTDNVCLSCPVNTYANKTGSTACIACSINSFNTQMGNTVCTRCDGGSIVAASQDRCVCPSGTYNQSSVCIKCDELCPEGYYISRQCSVHGNINCSECKTSCPVGQYLHSNCSSQSDLTCRPCSLSCPPGFYRHRLCSPTNDLECRRCSTGCPLNYFLKSSCTAFENMICEECPVNSYTDPSSPRRCIQCLDTQIVYQINGAFACKTCVNWISSNQTLCTSKCVPGEYPSSNKKCSACPPETYGVDGSTCQPCQPQFNCNVHTSGQTACQACGSIPDSLPPIKENACSIAQRPS